MKIDANTSLYAVFGNPVRHSKSPMIHNACFQHYRQNAVYLAFEADDISAAVHAVRTLDIKGASVTIPHKSTIMAHLDEIDPDARDIGAVNTIVNHKGRIIGYNTDCLAAVLPLKSFNISQKHVCIIGAGGAAQAVAFGMKKENAKLTILHRNYDSGQLLAERSGAEFVDSNNSRALSLLDIDILINTTPVGMVPHIDETPFPEKYLHSQTVVMDIVYNPVQTKLLRQASRKGCKTINGLFMFLYQAAAQFDLWTGISPDINVMKQALGE